MRRHGYWTALAVLVPVVAFAADRGIAVKRPAELGLGEYEPERCHALVVGISQYKYWPDLRCAADDAKAVAGVLRSAYGMKDVKLLLDDEATRRGILEAIDGYTKLTDRDCLFIYYAGHGEMDENRNGFWVPSDAPRNDKFSYIPNSQIVNDYFKKFKVKHLLVAADSCFSGAMLRGGPEQKREENWELPSGFRKPSRWILTSGDLAPVPDDAGTGHSPFATRLLQFLKYSDAPAFGVQDLYVYVRKTLKSSPICQPLDTDGHMPGGEYVFCRTGTPASEQELVPATPQVTPQPKTGFAGLFSLTAPNPPEPKEPLDVPVRPVTPRPQPVIPVQPASGGGTLVVYSPLAGIGTLDGEANFRIENAGSYTFRGLPQGSHKVRIVSAAGAWESMIWVTEGKKAELIADFSSARDAASVTVPPKEETRHRPKAH